MFKEDISQCCMECERLAGELAVAQERLKVAEGLLNQGRQYIPNNSLEATQYHVKVNRFLITSTLSRKGDDYV